LIGYLEAAGHTVKYPEYGYELAIETRIVNDMIIGAIFPYIGRDDILIGHSNGAAMAFELAREGAPCKGLILINAALERNIIRPLQVEWIDCYWNSGDAITEVAQVGEELGLYPQYWGEMGHAGYLGYDKQITSINCGATPGLPAVSGHSDIFAPANLQKWGPYIASRIR
jgi:pimeloyl-ACP methyl ester carboxylesterase